ncbi:MAG: hypothetical protein ACTSSH_02200, partial [Candidatus Heimdallarchaeota archaeon]
WLIEAVNKNNEKVELWESYWKTGRAQKHNRIWKAFYIPVTQSVELPSNPSPSLESLSKIFKTALTKIEAFARRNELDFWADIFLKALDLLLDESLVDVNDDFLPNCYTQKARQLAAVCKLSSVFGGMGSWNDQWFNDEDQDKLSRNLTEELYVVVNQGLVAAVNSFPEEK